MDKKGNAEAIGKFLLNSCCPLVLHASIANNIQNGSSFDEAVVKRAEASCLV